MVVGRATRIFAPVFLVFALTLLGMATIACQSPAGEPKPTDRASTTRPRAVILTDFPPIDVIPIGAGKRPAEKRGDPDDVRSMVRFLLYANDLDVEVLVASSATKSRSITREWRSGTYGKPARDIIGEDRDGKASDAIIKGAKSVTRWRAKSSMSSRSGPTGCSLENSGSRRERERVSWLPHCALATGEGCWES